MSRWTLGVGWIVAALLLPYVGASAQPRGGDLVVPVSVTPVTRQDVDVLLRAVGTVQALQTVTVRARVDGTLDKVTFAEGQMVKPGDVLAQLDPRPYQAVLDQAVAKKASDEAALAASRSDLVRYSELSNAQIASRQKFEQSRAAVAQGEAAVRGDDATIAAAQLNLSFTRITSPIEGRVGLRLIDPGNLLRVADANTPGIVTITQINPIAVVFTLPQDAMAELQAAAKRGAMPTMAFRSDDKLKLADGVVLAIESAIDQSTGTIKLKAVFPNPEGSMWPGQFVNVRVKTQTLTNVPTLPSAAVQRGPDGLYVYLVQQGANTVQRQAITLTQDQAGVAVIASGLNGGETVVLSGQSRLTNGSRVATGAAPKPAG